MVELRELTEDQKKNARRAVATFLPDFVGHLHPVQDAIRVYQFQYAIELLQKELNGEKAVRFPPNDG